MARVVPTAMIFIPCEKGISHNEIEKAEYEHVAAGANVLLRAVLAWQAQANGEGQWVPDNELEHKGLIPAKHGHAHTHLDSEAQQYYTAHPEAFRRNGVLMTFDQAIDSAREQASRERRSTRIAQWLAGLRKRTEIVRLTGASPAPSSAPAAN